MQEKLFDEMSERSTKHCNCWICEVWGNVSELAHKAWVADIFRCELIHFCRVEKLDYLPCICLVLLILSG